MQIAMCTTYDVLKSKIKLQKSFKYKQDKIFKLHFSSSIPLTICDINKPVEIFANIFDFANIIDFFLL